MPPAPGLAAIAVEVRARDELIARLAHEARTPIGAILTWLELLKAHSSSSPQATRAIAMAERSARELTEIVTGAEEAQRVMAGTMELQMTPLDLAAVLRSVVERALAGAQARNIVLDCETTTTGGPARGDAERLRNAFTRLLVHCVSLSGPGRVHVRLADERNGVRVDLLCSALTLSDALRDALQDESGWPSIAGPQGQVMLDFALACRVVGLHGGRLEAASLNGSGTRITATLPLGVASVD